MYKGERREILEYIFRLLSSHTVLSAAHAEDRAASSADPERVTVAEGGGGWRRVTEGGWGCRWAQVFSPARVARYSGAKWCGRYD